MVSVSIVVPVYNAEKFLPRCLDSIKAQTFTDFEVILINDGSVDNSLHICEAYRQKDDRFKVFTQKNAGPSVARNNGIDYSQGKYVAFIDSDDYIEPQMLYELYDAAEKNSADMTICGYNKVNASGDIVAQYKTDYESKVYTDDLIEKIAVDSINMKSCGNVRPFSWIRFVLRECLNNHNLRFDPTIRLGEDYLLWTKTFFKIDRLCLITDKYLYNYVQNSNSITQNYTPGFWQSALLTYETLINDLPSKKSIVDALDISLIQQAFMAMHIASRAKDKKVIKYEFDEIFSNKKLKKVLKRPLLTDSKEHMIMHLLMKLHMYWFIRIAFLWKYRKYHR